MHAYANAHAYKQVLNKKRLLLKREEAEVRTDDTQARECTHARTHTHTHTQVEEDMASLSAAQDKQIGALRGRTAESAEAAGAAGVGGEAQAGGGKAEGEGTVGMEGAPEGEASADAGGPEEKEP